MVHSCGAPYAPCSTHFGEPQKVFFARAETRAFPLAPMQLETQHLLVEGFRPSGQLPEEPPRRIGDDLVDRAVLVAGEVARVVEHALTAARPRTRYVVGREAKFRAAMALLVPDRVRDNLVAKAMGLPKTAPSAPPKAGEGAWG